MNQFSRLILTLDVYKDNVDKTLTKYQQEDSRNKELYNTSIYHQKHEALAAKCKSDLDKLRDRKISDVNGIIDGIQYALSQWVTTPVNEKGMNLILVVKQMGVKLSAYELDSLNDLVGDSYFGRKIMKQLAQENGVFLKSGPSLESYVQMLENAKNEAGLFVSYYVGRDLKMIDFLPNPNLNLAAAASTCRPFSANSSILMASAFWDGEDVPTSIERKSLTSDDKDILDKLFEGCRTSDMKKARVEQLVAENPDIRSFIELSSELRPYLPPEKI